MWRDMTGKAGVEVSNPPLRQSHRLNGSLAALGISPAGSPLRYAQGHARKSAQVSHACPNRAEVRRGPYRQARLPCLSHPSKPKPGLPGTPVFRPHVGHHRDSHAEESNRLPVPPVVSLDGLDGFIFSFSGQWPVVSGAQHSAFSQIRTQKREESETFSPLRNRTAEAEPFPTWEKRELFLNPKSTIPDAFSASLFCCHAVSIALWPI